ncbi:MAG: bifunctional serine/threonine-protein kinase/formylglycine-generating enzyme family protein [Bryobacteraceae bacterium]|nr:bifunctional serine/threonine-protein kinase/formylglycine-generating enzyme family protein [Bryobacteraceae bacterium]MDW8380234.1 bifunctional serine/threonine-protein kinase/formylglycine-generating enzyme family protein [Bryobacterales bacterium]
MHLPAAFGKYQLEKLLGGGMSQVYQATDTVLGRTVAIKILSAEGCRDEDAKTRFLLEAKMCASITHDNIIRVHDYGEIDGRPFIVMEFLTGEDLRSAIQAGRLGGIKTRLELALQAARALGHVHKQNIIHRDIKPENLHIDETGRLRLMDFGIAKAANLSLTRTGFAVGTPYYMAPEQVLGKPATPAVDIYGWGLLLYELLAGQRPLSGDSIEVLFFQILHQPLDLSPLQALSDVPAEVIDLIRRCTAKNPEDRPANFDIVIAELEAVLRNLDRGTQRPVASADSVLLPPRTMADASPFTANVTHEPQPPPSTSPLLSTRFQPKSRFLLVGAGLGLLAAVALAIVLRGNRERQTAESSKAVAPAAFALPDRYSDPITGAEMILIREGYFLFDKEARREYLDAFYIDRTEVSKAQWSRYARARGLPPPDGDPDEPVVNITIGEARQFATWAGKSLPNARQWEKAARGLDGRTFPWGNDTTTWKANLRGTAGLPPQQVQPVTAELGVSPFGLLNVAGNVWEYVDERRPPSLAFLEFLKARQIKVGPNDEFYTMRGGSFNSSLETAVVYEFAPVLAEQRSAEVGFRCVKPAKLVEQELRNSTTR